MSRVFNLAFVILCISVGTIYSAAPVISVSESNVPNVIFEVDAQLALQEAFVLFPSDTVKRTETFADLFQDLHPIESGWNVAEGCSIFYRSLKTYTYVSLNVTVGNATSIVKIYN